MEAILLCGVQGSGKTTLYRDHFIDTHVRVSMDLLRTRSREEAFVNLCLQTQQRFVVDNTNPTVAERRRYIAPARGRGLPGDRLPRRGRRGRGARTQQEREPAGACRRPA